MSEASLAIRLNAGDISACPEAAKRQLVIFPETARDGTRLILAATGLDMSLKTYEEIRLNYEDYPAIGILKHDGSVDIDLLFCLEKKIYTNADQLLDDLNLLLAANNLPKRSHSEAFGREL